MKRLKASERKRPKSDAQKTRDRLDRKMSLYIRARDGRCMVCGSQENLQNGHYLSRVFFNTRWDFENCNTQCARCNKMHEYDPEPYRQFMAEKYGEEIIQELAQKAHSGNKLSRDDLQSIEQEIDRKMALI